jgi:hypothetical protein
MRIFFFFFVFRITINPIVMFFFFFFFNDNLTASVPATGLVRDSFLHFFLFFSPPDYIRKISSPFI